MPRQKSKPCKGTAKEAPTPWVVRARHLGAGHSELRARPRPNTDTAPAAFFGYFLCGGKESDCRPAQGSMKIKNITKPRAAITRPCMEAEQAPRKPTSDHAWRPIKHPEPGNEGNCNSDNPTALRERKTPSVMRRKTSEHRCNLPDARFFYPLEVRPSGTAPRVRNRGALQAQKDSCLETLRSMPVEPVFSFARMPGLRANSTTLGRWMQDRRMDRH